MMVPGGVRTLKKIATRQNDIPDSGKFISVGPKSIIWLVSIRGKSLTEEPSPSGPLCEYGTLGTQVRQSDGFKFLVPTTGGPTPDAIDHVNAMRP